MALVLSERTDDLIYINHEAGQVDPQLLERLKKQSIRYIDGSIAQILQSNDGELTGVQMASGETLPAERGFIAFGGNEVRSDLAAQLGVERLENRHIVTDPRSKMTSVSNVWAAGDVGVHSEQVTIAMGEGAQAAIWMHKALHKIKDKAKVLCTS
jgi:thioredoxin reductase